MHARFSVLEEAVAQLPITAAIAVAVASTLPRFKPATQMRPEPEAEVVVAMIGERLRPGDKFYVQHPWDSPTEFLLLAQGSDTSVLDGPVAAGGKVMVAVSKRPEQTVEAVLRSHGQDPARWNDLQMVREWSGLKIFAAP